MDQIRIENLEVFAKHGVESGERALGQKFLVSVILHFDTSSAGLSDELSATINYSKVCHWICDFMKSHQCNLIESAAEYMARDLLIRFKPLLQEVTITIKKPWAPIGLPLDCASVTIHRKWHTAYLSMGSNMGDRRKNIKDAISALKKHKLCRVTKQSSLIETKPYGKVDQDDFINGVIEVKTLLRPAELLSLCHDLEAKAGRERKEHWGPRTLDLDILFYDSDVIAMKEPDLVIPHSDMTNREFVMAPLASIAPAMVHPIYRQSVFSLYEKLKKGNESEK